MGIKTYTAGVDLFLIDGEIFITQPHDDGEEKTIYSTKFIQDCPTLDRSLFVKGVGLDELAQDATKNIESPRFKKMSVSSFKAGYQANKAEFTRHDMENSFIAGIKSVTKPGMTHRLFDEFMMNIRPLSLPKSVTIDGDKIEVNW